MQFCTRGWRVWPVAARSRFACIENCIISADRADLAECNYAVETGVNGLAILAINDNVGVNAINELCWNLGDWSWMETLHYRHGDACLYIFTHPKLQIRSLLQYRGLTIHWGTHVLIPPSQGAVYADPDAPVLCSPQFLWPGGTQ
jgi:hypothetical protein